MCFFKFIKQDIFLKKDLPDLELLVANINSYYSQDFVNKNLIHKYIDENNQFIYDYYKVNFNLKHDELRQNFIDDFEVFCRFYQLNLNNINDLFLIDNKFYLDNFENSIIKGYKDSLNNIITFINVIKFYLNQVAYHMLIMSILRIIFIIAILTIILFM